MDPVSVPTSVEVVQPQRAVLVERCTGCKRRNATTTIKLRILGHDVYAKMCEECSKPIWHVMGLLDFLTKR